MARILTSEAKRRARIERAVKFLQGRITALNSEHDWGTYGKALPKNQPVPPDWVRKAILRTNERTLGPIMRLDPRIQGNVTYGTLMQLGGMGVAALSAIKVPPPPSKGTEAEEKEFARYMGQIVDTTRRHLVPAVKRQERTMKRLSKRLVPAGLKEIQENLLNLQKGAAAMLTPEGKFRKGQSKTAQLYMVMWYFWPFLKDARTAKEVYEILPEYSDVELTVKLVEKICTDLGMFKGKRGKPRAKIFLQAAQGV